MTFSGVMLLSEQVAFHLADVLFEPNQTFSWQKLKAFPTMSFVFLWTNMSYILYASCQLNQHLQDSLCQQLLQLDEVSILSPPASIGEGEEEGDGDMEQQVYYHCFFASNALSVWIKLVLQPVFFSRFFTVGKRFQHG